MKHRSGWVLSLASAGLFYLSGCSPLSMAKSAISEIRGAKGEMHPITPVPSGTMSGIHSIYFEPAMSTVGSDLAPPNLLTAYDAALTRDLQQDLSKSLPGGPPTLQISTEFLYFQKKGIFSGGSALARVRGRTDHGGAFEGMIHTESDALTQGGESAMGEATAKALTKYLKTHLKAADGK